MLELEELPLRLLELELLLRVLELELLLRLSLLPPRRPCADPFGAATVSIEVINTNVPSLLKIEGVFICCLLRVSPALAENEGLLFVEAVYALSTLRED